VLTPVEWCFWVCAAVVGYTYIGYPLVLLCAARMRGRPVRQSAFTGPVSIVVSACNEEGRIAARRDELVSLLAGSAIRGELLIVSDGSTDGTAQAAREGAGDCVKVIELKQNVGKAAALSRACEAATGDVLVFADARQRWAPDALRRLLVNFGDGEVGGVSGELRLDAPPGTTAGVGLYWRYEKALRALESRVHSTVGVSGSICAVRRNLFRPMPAGTLLDDVYWPMDVVRQGFRVVHDPSACAFDRLPASPRDEFRRKVRTLSGNFQLLARMPLLLSPWHNPIWLQFISHKLLRLAVPWLLISMFVASALKPEPILAVLFVAQAVAYILAICGMSYRLASRSRLLSAAGSFLVLNAAAWMAFWVWASGRAGGSWKKVTYGTARP
jgi:cellulose synthase/poly-beta-1,6-N-acetylglucosamine synthase-like glycosyltransferase